MASDKINACLECRKVKMRCRPGERADLGCERCARKSLECVFREHRRGRKPGTRVAKIARKKGTSNHSSNQDALPATGFDDMSHYETPKVDSDAECPAGQSSLQPAGLLNREAMRGKFSLQSILSTNRRSHGDVSEEYSSITLGLVNSVLAESLFENFVNVLNPYLCQLDPLLHTFSYVRQKSSFLLSSILAASAKIFNPALYTSLRNHAENLYLETVRMGKKSTEIVQAILILTYWKEPEDTRAWLTLGYVIRMCIDLDWHKLAPKSTHQRQDMTEKQCREARNIERTWLVLFVYDRSMSLQTGKPCMIERSEFIETAVAWGRDTLANDKDVMLCAFTTLRLMTSEAFKLLSRRDSLQSMESLLKVLSTQIDEWEDKWLQMTTGESESCHPFLIRFYGTHLRLQLFSLPLQKILGSQTYDISYSLEALWVSYSSAIEMLKLVCRFSTRLYFAQDSVHIMTAYAAAFLIKLLLSAPSSIVSDIEATTVEAIVTAARVFSQQAAPIGSSCFLQARFLTNIISTYEEARRNPRLQRPPPSIKEASYNSPSTPKQKRPMAGGMVSTQVGQTVDRNQQQREPLRIVPSRNVAPEDITSFSFLPGDNGTNTDNASSFNSSDMMESVRPDYAFMDDETWVTMFASAGFSLEEGVFSSSLHC